MAKCSGPRVLPRRCLFLHTCTTAHAEVDVFLLQPPSVAQEFLLGNQRMPQSKHRWDVRFSKALAFVLRHDVKSSSMWRTDGSLTIRELLATPALHRLRCTPEDVIRVVATNDKQRFECIDDGALEPGNEMEASLDWCIRAHQGNSIPVEGNWTELDAVTVPVHLVHETDTEKWLSIRDQ